MEESGAEDVGHVLGGDGRLGGEVERARRPGVEHPGHGVGDVVGVHHRDTSPESMGSTGTCRSSAAGTRAGNP